VSNDLTMSSGATKLAGTPPSALTQAATPGGGWLSASGSIDHGRFGPGTVLDSRYRIIGLLGKGGMGEVYRADDLRLGQPVALKFLPAALATDAKRLAQLHNEVRTARQVSHANVCRVYDIGDVSGHLFLSMEFVDGEDLAASLRRVGRFPEDRALELARQICAGLAAAHDRGVIHRDLKPANIMIDSAGRARIMDFGLASAEAVEDVRVGTPAYMAPEQLEGREVTFRSDIFALGLVLYELFTGKRVFTAATLADLVEAQAAGRITPPTDVVKTLDPRIERAILRCLDREPARRPASVLAVSAALPGGDPLAAALAAGETPSPEMVAAAGGDQATVSRVGGAMWLLAVAILMYTVLLICMRYGLTARSPFPKPTAVLADRAQEIQSALGYNEPGRDQAWGYLYDTDYLNWANDHGSPEAHWRELADGQPAVVRFWYRASPRPLVPFNPTTLRGPGDPPFGSTSGMTRLYLDTKGRLLSFEAAPPQTETAALKPGAGQSAAASPEWPRLIEMAGFDASAVQPVDPGRTPTTFADTRYAWRGRMPGMPTEMTIEAASFHGRVVYFEVVGPWTRASRDVTASQVGPGNGPGAIVTILALLVIAGILTRRNLKTGRADRRGAFRLGVFVVSLTMVGWALWPHMADLSVERNRMFVTLGVGLFLAGALYIVYLAIEPFVRRSWPSTLVSWSRLLSGRFRDPYVGRDLLIGIATGLLLVVVHSGTLIVPRWLGWPEPMPPAAQAAALVDLRQFLASVVSGISQGLQSGLLTLLQIALLRFFVQSALTRLKLTRVPIDVVTALAAVVVSTTLSLLDAGGAARTVWLSLAATEVVLVATVVLIMRVGLLAIVFANVSAELVTRIPLTLDGSRFYAGQGWAVVAALIGLAICGYWWASAGQLSEQNRRTSEPGT
jgi:serine/threonine-protein kinase